MTIVLPLKGLAAWHRHECNDGIIAYNSWESGGAVSPPAYPGQSHGRGPGGGASGSSSDYTIYDALKWLRILHILRKPCRNEDREKL